MSNTNDHVAAAQQPQRGIARGRGRGGMRGGNRAASKAGSAKAQPAKVGPTRLLETEWVKDAAVSDSAFVYAAISGKAGDQQWTFHHPIGETSLDARQWVATPTRDVSFLIQRKENEALSAWKRQGELAKRQLILRRATGRRIYTPDDGDSVEVWAFDGAPAIQPTIRTCMAAAKTAGAKDSEWLNYADQAVQVAERSFKQALRDAEVPEAWIRANPKPAFETRGGALGDVPQVAVEYLNGLSLAAARDKVTRVAIGLDRTDTVPLPPLREEPEPVRVASRATSPRTARSSPKAGPAPRTPPQKEEEDDETGDDDPEEGDDAE